jgi:hypothetical protein
MNPWITRQASDSRIDDLRRAASLDRLAREAGSSERELRAQPLPARLAGELLLRAGRSLAGEARTRQVLDARRS